MAMNNRKIPDAAYSQFLHSDNRRAQVSRVSENRIPSSKVREICGGVSDMTIWRWQQAAELNFPKPIYIGRRRYWREADVITWLEDQAGS